MTRATELDALIQRMVDDYLSKNEAARVLRDLLDDAGVGFWPVMDHLTVRTTDIDARAKEFTDLGYEYAETLEFENWFAKVYRLEGYPAMFIDQAYTDERGKGSIIPRWVATFGDQTFHHIAARVEDIEKSIAALEARGVSFAGEIIGDRGGDLRQIFSSSEVVDGAPFSVLELTERHRGYMGFSPPQADALMQASAVSTGR